jgi:hypothetical protein
MQPRKFLQIGEVLWIGAEWIGTRDEITAGTCRISGTCRIIRRQAGSRMRRAQPLAFTDVRPFPQRSGTALAVSRRQEDGGRVCGVLDVLVTQPTRVARLNKRPANVLRRAAEGDSGLRAKSPRVAPIAFSADAAEPHGRVSWTLSYRMTCLGNSAPSPLCRLSARVRATALLIVDIRIAPARIEGADDGLGIRVNALAPGWVRTPMTKGWDEDKDLNVRMKAAAPMHRGAEPMKWPAWCYFSAPTRHRM